MNEVRWDDKEDEDVLHPVKEQTTKDFLRRQERGNKPSLNYTHVQLTVNNAHDLQYHVHAQYMCVMKGW